jgi:hypothetical protein
MHDTPGLQASTAMQEATLTSAASLSKAKEHLAELEYTMTEMMDIVGMLAVEAEAAASAPLNAKRKDVKFKAGTFVVLHAPIRTKGAASRLTKRTGSVPSWSRLTTVTRTTPSSTSMQVPLHAMAYTICVPRHQNYSREHIKNVLPLCVEKILHPLPALLPTIRPSSRPSEGYV